MHPEIGQQFGMCFVRHDQVVAYRTVVRDRHARLAGVISIVATEAPCGVGVADVVLMRSPANVHRREDIVRVDIHERIGRSLDL